MSRPTDVREPENAEPETPERHSAPGRRMRLVYDGELELIDKRQESEARRELSARGIDLDQGFALQVGDQWNHGSEVLHRLTLLDTRSGVFNQLMYRLFASPQRAARLYPGLKACRNALLRLCRIPPIDNLRR
ncbi:hypothetical protein ACGTN6_16945 [Halomonas sp. THAF12]|uniref:hypothetical protein n=1 Tax=Halomonas sp. B23F22_10 TaxID=3459515 RepID=UPI00373F726D